MHGHSDTDLAPTSGTEHCGVHPEVAAEATCSRCGNYMCRQCRAVESDRGLCRPCWELVAPEQHFGDASRGQRFANLVLDSVAGAALLFPVAVVDAGLNTQVLDWVPDVLVSLVYYFVMEAAFGVTLGKLVTRTRVIAQDGGRPGLMRVLGRTLIRFIPFEAFTFVLLDRGWHDAWADTRVVRTRPSKQTRAMLDAIR